MKNKKEKINLRKFLFILPLLLLALITTVVATFAWWNTLTVEKDVKGTIGDSVVLELTAADFNGVLVPEDVYNAEYPDEYPNESANNILNQPWVKEWSTKLEFKVNRTDTPGASFVLTITSVEIFVDGVDRISYFDLEISEGEDDDLNGEDDDLIYDIEGEDDGLSYDITTSKTLYLKLRFEDIIGEAKQNEVRTIFAGKQLTVRIKAKITAQS